MRLKEDSDNWNASSVIRQELRHGSDDDVPKRISRRKDTRRWCKGKRGISHDYKMKILPWVYPLTVKQMVCTKCGKRDWKTVRYNKDNGN